MELEWMTCYMPYSVCCHVSVDGVGLQTISSLLADFDLENQHINEQPKYDMNCVDQINMHV